MGAVVAILGEKGDPELAERLQRMLARSPYRGTPEQLIEGPLAIGVQNLGSDASLAQHGNWIVAFHGYIGNWPELSSERGWSFPDGASNAAKMAIAFEDLGNRLFAKLRGEWALLIWDRSDRKLLAARDVVGCRPLFVHRHAERRFLASEVRQILAGSDVSVEIDIETFRRFLRVEANPDGSSVRDVNQVTPGSAWSCVANGGAHGSEPFFRFGSRWNELGRLDLEGAAEVLRAGIGTAVARASAGPQTCVALSGGLDSSTVWGFVRGRGSVQEASSDVSALCLRYPGRDDDEGAFMNAVLDQRPGPRRDIQLRVAMVMPCLREATAAVDTPFLANIVAQLELARAAATEGKKVILTGHGGDLAFQGNPLDLEDAVLRQHDAATAWWAARLATGQRMWGDVCRRLTRNLAQRSPAWFGLRSDTVSTSGDLCAEARAIWEADLDTGGEAGRRTILQEIAVERAGWVLTPWEQLNASFGVEARHPLLDLDVLEVALSVPQKLHLACGFRKGLLRVAAQQYLPEKVRSRRGKMALSAFVEDGLEGAARGPGKTGTITVEGMEDLLSGHDDGFTLPLRLLVDHILRARIY
jgi:asparagine synthetase B (glutamine-hydrolysing)